MITFLILIATYVASALVLETVGWLFQMWRLHGVKKRTEEWCKTLPLTEEDKQLIEDNRELMRELFPDGIENKFRDMPLADRVEKMKELIERANQIYGVGISTVKFAPGSEIGDCTLGYFDKDTNCVAINVDILASDDADVMRAIVGTVFHELRHALQYKAITDSDFHYGTEEQRRLWALNVMEGNYIPPEVDFVLYQRQAVEADARQIAEHIIENF